MIARLEVHAMSAARRLTFALTLVAVVAAPAAALGQGMPLGELDLYNVPNWTYSPTPTIVTPGQCSVTSSLVCIADSDCPVSAANVPETCTGLVVSGGMHKFIDALPGLCPMDGPAPVGSSCLPIAIADKTTYPGSDYYEIGLRDYTAQFHGDLPATTRVRGYYQKNAPVTSEARKNHFLGPIILAPRDRPVRVLFVNELPTSAAGGNLFIPVDRGIPGVGPGPVVNPDTGKPWEYSDTRATLHLHGGNTQWISDGTQHQWTAAVNEYLGQGPELDVYRKGVATAYVPDMWFDSTNGATIGICAGATSCGADNATTNPGEGKMTFYWPNQQSGRLLFYHDHAYGITRLNVYAGEAAGYLIYDAEDDTKLNAAGVPGTVLDLGHLVPLVIQDKTFVPGAAALATTDPTWDVNKWGGEGSLWYPHVYTPNQWPDSPALDGSNPMGRWDYGPWFWPVQTQLGAAKPTPFDVTIPCRTMAGVAPGGTPLNTICPITPNPSLVPESFLDTLIINGKAFPTVTVEPHAYRFQILNASQERHVNLSFFQADPAHPTEVRMVEAYPHQGARGSNGARGTALPAVCSATATLSQVTGLPFGPDLPGTPVCWPRLWPTDARAGGVPNPADAGPAFIQIGSEGGILPAPVVIPAQPVDYENNKRNIVVLNVTSKGLFMGSAERADVVVDFSKYAGKTLILYNDAPAPVPAGDPRNDYYTGNPDTTATGGPAETVPGYGPNTRTIMQIVVKAAGAPATPWAQAHLATTAAAQTDIFKTKQPTPIVPEEAYSAVAGTTLANTYLGIQALNLNFTPVGGAAATNVIFGNKAIHELFDVDYGRMNSVLGVEIPNTNWVNQTTIPFTNADPNTEWIENDRPQIWKITHNGVDTHAIHFHLLNAQVVNRVGWDGAIRPPDANELGWKDTIRMNPLEDIIIALQPVKQNLPWPLPDSWRPVDVTTAVGQVSPLFSQVNANNLPYAQPLKNYVQNYGQEYVWHCHLLGHEENDMLRAEVFIVPPEAPATASAVWSGSSINVSWVDRSASELGFSVERDVTPLFNTPSHPTFNVNRFGAEITGYGAPVSYPDAGPLVNGTTYYYRVQAYKTFADVANPAGPANFSSYSDWSNTAVASAAAPPAASIAPNPLDFGTIGWGTTAGPLSVTVTNSGGDPLTVSSVTLSGANPALYSIVNNCLAPLAGGSSCTVDVTFKPTTPGSKPASLVFVTNAAVNPVQAVALTGVASGPVAGLSPASLAFGLAKVGTTSAAQLVTLSNTGDATLDTIAVALGGVDAASYAISASTCGATLAAAASCTVSVTFSPLATGLKSASLVVTSADPVSPSLSVALSGTGAVPVAGVAPASLTFPVTLVQNVSAAQVVTLTNSGTWPLTVSAVTLAGTSPGQFAQSGGCVGTLAVGASCTTSVTFAPITGGAFSASLQIASDDLVNPVLTVPISGTSTVLALSTASLSFGNVVRTRSSSNLTVIIANNGSTTLTGFGVSSSNPEFVVTQNCGTTISPAQTCRVTAQFQPTAVGPQSATLSIASSNPVSPITVALTGTGVEPVATLTTPATLSFTSRSGSFAGTQNITIRNTGTSPLGVAGLLLGGTTPSDFRFSTGTCTGNLPVGASCTATVRFRSFTVGVFDATLTVDVGSPATPVLVNLSGTATP